MEKSKLLKLQSDVTKKELLRDQMLYNMNNYPLSLQEKTAVKTVVKQLEISINQMKHILK